jgi:hypothetical protein
MKKDEITIGGAYLAKVSDKVVPVRIDAANSRGGWDATNLTTDKKVRIKSAQRLRGPAPKRDASQRARAVAEAQAVDATVNAHAVDPDRVPLAEAMKPAKAKRGKAAKEPREKNPSGLDAACGFLKGFGKPMRCGDLVQRMLERGLWKSGGKTPAATIYAAILREISTKGTEARFKKTDRGLFTANA